MISFVPNIHLPENYITALSKIAVENNMTAEQFVRNIIARHLEKVYREYL